MTVITFYSIHKFSRANKQCGSMSESRFKSGKTPLLREISKQKILFPGQVVSKAKR